jgi:hypothetical protein
MKNYCNELGVSYLFHKAIADKEKALLSLELLLNNSVGIGDHSTGDFHSNLDEALDLLVDATDRLDILKQHYGREEGQLELPF